MFLHFASKHILAWAWLERFSRFIWRVLNEHVDCWNKVCEWAHKRDESENMRFHAKALISATFALAVLNGFLRAWFVYSHTKLSYMDCVTIEQMPRFVASGAWQFLIFCCIVLFSLIVNNDKRFNKIMALIKSLFY